MPFMGNGAQGNNIKNLYLSTLRKMLKDDEDEKTFQQKKTEEAELFARQGAQNTRYLASQLTSGDLSSYKPGDVKNLDRDILRQSVIDNAAYRQALSDMGLFNQKEYGTNPQTIILPQTDYLKQLQDEFNLGRAASLVQDDFNKAATQRAMEQEAQKKALLPQLRSAYNDMAARGVLQNGNYTVEDLLYIDSMLNGTPRRSAEEFDALPDDEWASEYERMEKAAAEADWDKLLNPDAVKAPEGYESKTPMYDEYLKMISKELTRRAEVERYEKMAEAMSAYAEQQGYGPTGVYKSGYPVADPNTFAGNIELGRRYANDQAYAINNPLSYDDAQKIIGEELWGLEGAYNMTDDEKYKYNTLLRLNPQTANAYYQALLPELTARSAQAEDEYARTRAEDPLLAAFDTGASILKGPVGTAMTGLGALAGIDDPNHWIYGPQRLKDVTIGTAAETYGKLWDTEFLGQPLGSTAYNAVVSLLEMMYEKKLSGGLTQAAGGGTTFAKAAMQTLMSSQTAAGTYMQDLERGFTPEQAAAHGLINGAIEAWSERGFMDNLFSDDGKFMYKVLTGGLAEGLEELESGGLQLVSDAMVSYLTDNVSEVEQVYNYYKQTMGAEAAKAQTMTYFAEQLALQGITGWVTGAGTTGSSEAGQYMYNRSLGKSIQKSGDPAAVLDVGLSMDPESASYKLAAEIKAGVDAGKAMSLADLGKLTGQLDEDLTSEQSKVVDGVFNQAIIDRLVELGATEKEAREKAQQVREATRKKKTLTPEKMRRMGWEYRDIEVYYELKMSGQAREAMRRAESEAFERTPDQNQPMLAPELAQSEAMQGTNETAEQPRERRRRSERYAFDRTLEQNRQELAPELEEELTVEELIERGPAYPPTDDIRTRRREEKKAWGRKLKRNQQELAPELAAEQKLQELKELMERTPEYPPDDDIVTRRRAEAQAFDRTLEHNQQELAPELAQDGATTEDGDRRQRRSERSAFDRTLDQNQQELAPELAQDGATTEDGYRQQRRSERRAFDRTLGQNRQELAPEMAQDEATPEQPRERRRRTENEAFARALDQNRQELAPEDEIPTLGQHGKIRSAIEWLDETDAKLLDAQQKISDKRDKLFKAMSRTTAEDVSQAVGNAREKTTRKNRKPENQRSKKMTYETTEGPKTGEFDRFVQEGNQLRAVIKDGTSETTVDLQQIMDEGGIGTATILEYTMESDHQMTAEEGNTLMNAYQETGGDAAIFIEDFEKVYAAGFAGIEAPTTNLPTSVQEKVYQEAVEAGVQAEEDRVNKAKRVRADTEGSVAWLGPVADNSAIRGKGDQNALQEALEGMTESQRTTVDVIQQMAKKLRVNVVLYQSQEGNIGNTANGMYNSDTNVLYVDINSGVSSAKGLRKGRSTNTIGYAMMLTMGHELTHHLEATSPEGYTRYRDAVKKQLAANGESWAELVRSKIMTAAAQGRKLTRKGAEAEVIADASEYMLQYSKFVTGLEGGLRSRVKTFVQGFVDKVRSIFNHLVSGHRESAALRKVIDGVNQYTGDLQKLWDAALGETITKPEARHAGTETDEESPKGRRGISEAKHAGTETDEESPKGRRGIAEAKHAGAETDEESPKGKKSVSVAKADKVESKAVDQPGKASEMVEEDYTELLAYEGVSSMEEFQEKLRRESMEMNAFSMREDSLLTPAEYRRVESAWFDYTSRGYKFFVRRNGGIIVDLDSVIVYTDDNGQPEYVLEVGTDNRWTNNDVYNKVVEMEREGIRHGVQYRILESLFGKKGAHFRTREKRHSVAGEKRKGTGRNAGEMGRGDHGKVSEEITQLSTRDLPDGVTVREYLGALKPTSRMTDTERELLGRYQAKLKVLQETEELAAQENEILKKAHGDDLLKSKSRYMTYRNKANRTSRELSRIERAEGFAGLMATSRTLLDEYLLGTAGDMADAQDRLDEEVQNLTNRLQEIGNTLEDAAKKQRDAFARGMFDQKQLDEAAKQLKESYNSRMSVKQIANRLALAYGELYANEGAEGAKKFTEAAKELAQDILNSSKYRYHSEVLTAIAEELPTISLTETDKQEIRNAGLSLAEYKRGLSPYVRVAESASDLRSYVTNAEAYGGQIARILGDDTEGNLAMALYNVIQAERADEAAATFEGMSESASLSVVMADVVSLNLPKTANDGTLEYLRKELQKYAGENEQASRSVDEAIKAAKRTTARASDVWREAVKTKETANKVVEYYRALEEQRRLLELQEQKKTLTEQLKGDAAQKLHDRIKEQRQEYREREQKARTYRATRADLEKLRRSIGRKVKRLNALRMRETDQKHVPQELQHVTDVIMQTFTESNLARLAFAPQQTASLARRYRALQALERDMTYFWDDEIAEDIENLQALGEAYTGLTTNPDGSVARVYTLEGVALETEILQGVDNIVSNVMRMIDSENDQFIRERTETFEQFAKKTGDDLLKLDDAKVRKGKLGDLQMALDEMFRTGNMTPVYFFESLKNQRFTDVFNGIRKGQTEAARIIRESQAFVQETMAKYHYGRWAGDGKITFQTGQGHQITLSREQAMWAYATAKREKSNPLYKTEHLLVGGFQYKDTANTGEGKNRETGLPHQLDNADIARIGQWLTDEQKAYADEIVGYLSSNMAEYGNEASMRMYGYRKFNESYYFPFQTSAEQRIQRGDEGAGGENAGTGRVKNAGFTKKLQHGANATLLMDDFTRVAVEHMQKMANYSAMVEPIEDLKRLLNHRILMDDGTIQTIRALMGQKYGKPAQNYMQELLKDLNGAAQGDKRATKGVDYMVNAFKRGAVMGSLSVVLQQPTALARAMSMVDPKHFTNNPFYRPSKGVWDEMLKYSGTAIIKDMGKFDMGMGKSASEYIMDEHLTPKQAYERFKGESKAKGFAAGFSSFMNWLTSAPGKADQWTWGLLWQAVKNETASKHPGMNTNSEEFLELVGERFDDVVDHTQVYDSVLTRSNLMRSTNAIHKMATAFKAEPTLAVNMLYNAVFGGHGKAKAGVIIGSVMASQILAGLLSALVQAWNDDKDKRNWLEKYADKASSNILDNINPLGMVPYISDIMSLMQGYEVERADMTVFATLIKYTGQFWDKLTKGEALTMKDWENFAGNWANLTGVPAKNILREIRRTKNVILNTDWGAPNMANLGYTLMENMPFYSGNNSVYYERLAAALLKGDEEEAENLRGYMLTSKMASADAIDSGVKKAVKDMYADGKIDTKAATDFLVKNGLAKDATEAYWAVDKWEWMRETGGAAGDYRKYEDFYKAVETGKDLKKVLKTYTDNGVTTKTLAANLTEQYKPKLKALYKTNKTEYSNLQARILTAYQALGYDRDKKLKDIQKWLAEP